MGAETSLWFDGWDSLIRMVVLGALGYVTLIVLLRISGKRSLSKMNAFDFVITVALGSVFATLILSESISLAEGVTAVALLVGMQWVVSFVYVRSRWMESVVKGSPQLLYWQGTYLDGVLKRERVTHEEVQAAMRNSNVTDHRSAAAVLETDGSITVIVVREDGASEALDQVRTY